MLELCGGIECTVNRVGDRYYNMDQVVAQALTVWQRICSARILTLA